MMSFTWTLVGSYPFTTAFARLGPGPCPPDDAARRLPGEPVERSACTRPALDVRGRRTARWGGGSAAAPGSDARGIARQHASELNGAPVTFSTPSRLTHGTGARVPDHESVKSQDATGRRCT